MTNITLQLTIPETLANKRLDQALSSLLPDYSRARIQSWIKNQSILLDNKPCENKTKIHSGQIVAINALVTSDQSFEPQAIALDIVYADEDLIVINKPIGLVVHPGAGCKDRTLLNALLHHFPELAELPRAGIIHRLDKDTSGLLVIARNLATHTKLVADMQERKIKREYVALVQGVLTSGGTIDAPIGRHRNKRTQMAVIDSGKTAITHYRVLKKFPHHTFLRVILETGRTHQIRVHFAHIDHPIVGDRTYGRNTAPAKCSPELRNILQNFNHQALHARYLELTHPRTGKRISWEIEIPEDIQNLLERLASTTQ